MTVKVTGEVVVKAGYFTAESTIEKFVNANTEWIENQRRYYKNKYHYIKMVTEKERRQAQNQLLDVMRELTEKYSSIMGLKPEKIKITTAEKRWGSCSSKNTICFSYRCAFLSQKCKEYIVIHPMTLK